MSQDQSQIQIRRPVPHWDVEVKSADAFTGDTPRQLCRQYVLSILMAGHGSRRHRGGLYHAAPGACALMQPDEVYSGSAQGMTYRSLWVAPAALASVAADVTGADAPPRFRDAVLADAILADRVGRLARLAESPRASPTEVEGVLVGVLAHLLTRHAERRASGPAFGAERRVVRQLRDYLEDNFSQDVSLGCLASLCGLSAYRLAHVFRRAVGVAPHEYQIQARVARAKSLLAKGVAAGEVAQRVGFFDQAHLTRHFRRLVQVTPGSYQRHCRGEAARTYKIGQVTPR